LIRRIESREVPVVSQITVTGPHKGTPGFRQERVTDSDSLLLLGDIRAWQSVPYRVEAWKTG